MRKAQALVVLAVLTVTACGKGKISGTVQSNAGKALDAATVKADPAGKETQTDSAGKYALEEVSRGDQSVTASRTGYASQTKAVNIGGIFKGDAATLDFTLEPAAVSTGNLGSILGTVKNSAGQPVAGATVRTNPPTQQVTTDSGGVYTVRDIERITYTVTASKSGYADTSAPTSLSDFSAVTLDFTLRLATKGTATVGANQAFNFAAGTVMLYDPPTVAPLNADIYHWYDAGAGVLYVKAVNGAGIQSLGLSTLDAVGSAPSSGYVANQFQAVGGVGTVYVVKTGPGNYAKYRITSGSAYIEYAYQSAPGNLQF